MRSMTTSLVRPLLSAWIAPHAAVLPCPSGQSLAHRRPPRTRSRRKLSVRALPVPSRSTRQARCNRDHCPSDADVGGSEPSSRLVLLRPKLRVPGLLAGAACALTLKTTSRPRLLSIQRAPTLYLKVANTWPPTLPATPDPLGPAPCVGWHQRCNASHALARTGLTHGHRIMSPDNPPTARHGPFRWSSITLSPLSGRAIPPRRTHSSKPADPLSGAAIPIRHDRRLGLRFAHA